MKYSYFKKNKILEYEENTPCFAGPSKDGGKIFKATPHIIISRQNALMYKNIIVIMIFVVALVLGLTASLYSTGEHNLIFAYTGSVLAFISGIIILGIVVSTPGIINTYTDKMRKVYLEISLSGLKGMTVDENIDPVYFFVAYRDINRIVYNNKQIGIYTKDGKYYNYNVFYNPYEIYTEIMNMKKKQQTLQENIG